MGEDPPKEKAAPNIIHEKWREDMMEQVFTPHKLKTIEVDVEKKIFRINGEEFGKECSGFTIHCKRYNDFNIRVEIDTTVHYATYGENQQKMSETTYQTNAPWLCQYKHKKI